MGERGRASGMRVRVVTDGREGGRILGDGWERVRGRAGEEVGGRRTPRWF